MEIVDEELEISQVYIQALGAVHGMFGEELSGIIVVPFRRPGLSAFSFVWFEVDMQMRGHLHGFRSKTFTQCWTTRAESTSSSVHVLITSRPASRASCFRSSAS